jgi:hypothetical protein
MTNALVNLDRARDLLLAADQQPDPRFARTLVGLAAERLHAVVHELRQGPNVAEQVRQLQEQMQRT